MKTSDFDYHLPPECIAQIPLEPRHAARLLVLNRAAGTLAHAAFWDISNYLLPGDLLVINRTRVLAARLYARKPTGGRVELLLVKRVDERTWEALVGGKRVVAGSHLRLEDGPEVEIVSEPGGTRRVVRFSEPVEEYMAQRGNMPLPPYIHTPLNDPERYQTVYAEQPGSAAAPTAGLHFTQELMSRLEERGVHFADVTLHVGLDTFAPVEEDDPCQHAIHSEWCELPPTTAAAIRDTKRAGGRVVAVGTTSMRTIESAARQAAPDAVVEPFSGATALYILPGFQFRAVDALVTNFHLPRSTLLMLVSAFAGRETILAAYQEAIRTGYRFYSFGDAMLIL
ncbi:MAG: tRNA preQ1(34) S-adenosylmethionine ribosyltransferase-isomerase QueA [Anaerolineaceae bacterium]|nr:tRNA preQ1(34) S-adenosylmethionine ribosyltransferase-isomerase QueA [Anaerolineaceae bacterium]